MPNCCSSDSKTKIVCRNEYYLFSMATVRMIMVYKGLRSMGATGAGAPPQNLPVCIIKLTHKIT